MVKLAMVKDILQIGNPILNQKTKKVTDFNSEETKQIISDLLDTCIANKDGTAGLAAPQIGYDKAICICRRTDLEEVSKKEIPDTKLWQVLINPQVTTKSNEETIIWEGCLSIGKEGNLLYGPVTRASKVTVSFQNSDGTQNNLSGEKFFSHLMQHEIDHLNGILFLTYVRDPRNIWKAKELNKYIKKHDQYPPVY